MVAKRTQILGTLGCVAASGCSFLTPPIENPIIEHHSGQLGAFATVAERRVVLTKRDFSKTPEAATTYDSRFCAEPPPDATQSIASALTAAISGRATGLQANPEASAAFAKSLETTAKALFQRSQGVQLFRDGSYVLCQAYLNEAISRSDYLKQYQALLGKASALIDKELDKMPSVDIRRAEEAASASEAAKDAAVKAKVETVASQAQIAELVRKAEAAAKRAEEAGRKWRL